MTISFHSILGNIAAEAQGIDLRQPLSAKSAAQIEEALNHWVVLVFRRQKIDDDMQQAFIENFGPPVVTGSIKELVRKGHKPHLLDIATVDENGEPLKQGSFYHLYMLANQIWHTDGSQSQPPIRLTALSARTLPPSPPNTEYADMRAAWDALPPERQKQLEDLEAEHSIMYSRGLLGLGKEAFSEESAGIRPPVNHALVRTHATGRKSLYLSSHASHIVGQPVEEGRRLLAELTAFATQPRFVYEHRWEPDDLVMWNDAASMHRALPYSDPHPRVLRWSAVRELEPV